MKANRSLFRSLFFFLSGKKIDCPINLQKEKIEAGSVALQMVLEYYGKYVTVEELRDLCGSRDGSNTHSILKAAEHYGMIAEECGEEEIAGLDNYELPLILCWNLTHFVVYKGRKGNKFYINDPAIGHRVVGFREMDESFSGPIIKCKPGPDFKKSGKKSSLIGSIGGRLTPVWGAVFFVFLAGLFMVPLNILVPGFSSIFIDKIMMEANYAWCMPLIMLAVMTLIFLSVLYLLQQSVLIDFCMKLSLSDTAKFFHHVLRLPINFFSSRTTGELAGRITGNETIAYFLANQLAPNLLNFVTLFFYAWLLFHYDFMLGFFCTLTSVLLIILLKTKLRSRRLISKELQQEMGKLTGASAAGISLIETLKSSGGENDYFSYWSGIHTNVSLTRKKMEVSVVFFNALPAALMALNAAVIVCFGAYRVLTGSMTSGNLLAFQLIAAYFFAPISALVAMSTNIQEIDATIERLDDVSKYKEDPLVASDREEAADTDNAEKLDGYIELKNISFGYDIAQPPMVKNFSMKLKPGERVALVGSSGSGKSTLAKIIAGLYQPWEGEVLFDGRPRVEIPSSIFTSSFSTVDQDIFIFKGTVYENLTMRNSSISMEQVERAAKDAEIHEAISLRPSGYFSMLAEEGLNYSGGQRQRLEIARALATNPSILVLDEATSALDPVMEKNIDRNIRKRGCTTIIVAHRLSTIRDADRIIVLEKGVAVEEGTHDELLALNNKYAALIRTM